MTPQLRKYQYLLRSEAHDIDRFNKLIMDVEVPRLLAAEPGGLKLSLTTEPPPRATILPLRPNPLALISLWSLSDPTPADWASGHTPDGLSVSGYRIEESVPRRYHRDWADGETSPGVVVLTLLKQNPKISYSDFLQEWHGRHTPKALRIHPLWNYIRNVINEPVIENSAPFEGIVEEHFRTRPDALNPVRFFGGPLKFLPNMLEVFLHVRHFMDLKQSENYFLRETWIKTPNVPDQVP